MWPPALIEAAERRRQREVARSPDGEPLSCSLCGGRGTMDWHRCAPSMAWDCSDFLRAWGFLRSMNEWPMPGGYTRQSAPFLEAVRLCDAEVSKIQHGRKRVEDAGGGG